MLTHDQIAFAVTKLYPELKHGKDFWVAQPVERDSGKQIGDADIVEWPKELEQPDRKILQKTFKAHADEFHAQQAKVARLAKLKESDWTQLMDVPEATRQSWAAYRQALRDLPQQNGFPMHIVWPTPPETEHAPQTPPPEPARPVPKRPPAQPHRPGHPPPFDTPE